jgi:hypothetical protein
MSNNNNNNKNNNNNNNNNNLLAEREGCTGKYQTEVLLLTTKFVI